MSVTAADLALYVAALFVLFLTPGPVWLALTARALSGGFMAAWPLAFGVALGDALWPALAVLGTGWLVAAFPGVMLALKAVAVAMFLLMGIALIRHAQDPIAADGRLTRPGAAAGFAAGVAVILANPKAILFYMGVLPGFFDLARLTAPDIAAIVAASVMVPLIGNTGFAALVGGLRARLTGAAAIARTRRISGMLLIVVAGLVAVT